MDLPTFIAKWKASGASERANKDSFLRDLCDVLGVPHPDAKTGDPERDRYVFEREAVLVHGGERDSIGFIDLYKHGRFRPRSPGRPRHPPRLRHRRGQTLARRLMVECELQHRAFVF